MLNVIWLILKVIGMILAVLLGIIITAALLIFLVPIRYRATLVKTKESINLEAKISWLLHIISINFKLDGKKKRIKVRIFGKPIYDSDKKKKSRLRRKSADKKNKIKENEVAKNEISEDEVGNNKISKNEVRKNKISKNETIENDLIENKSIENKLKENNISENDKSKVHTDSSRLESALEDKQESIDADDEPSVEAGNKDIGVVEKIINILYGKYHDILSEIKTVLARFKGIFESADKLKQGLKSIIDVLWTEERKKLYLFSIKLIKRIIRHMMPRKINGNILFGTGDPYYTGQVFTYLGMVYGIYGKYLNISADFEEKKLEADFKIRGRIRMITVAVLSLRLLKKDMRKLIKDVKSLKVNFQTLY